ncbi:interleukin 21 receptor, tandem duplicate 1 [Cyprinodon tularosa]|uniref:interleukin 21 receptor, tandem duplicate 1 n=1 Tax=Cyprinodon tularosa TaxID=77115 RepID=UPI0018E22D78|nr:interleukin 21 receptor, tandem duplicate 1 [Cyprinodon tularosa]
MAPPPLFLSLLWVLTVFIGGAAASVCNITCSTDYNTKLNCSCSGSVPALPVRLNVTCSDDSDDEVKGSCEIKPPHSWCSIVEENLYLVASVDNICSATVSLPSSEGWVELNESFRWAISQVVKPEPPVNIKVANATDPGFYNITWSDTSDGCLIYGVRIRNATDLFQDIINEVQGKEKYFRLSEEILRPDTAYIVDVRAKHCPDYYLQGPWSEWSSGIQWITAKASQEEEDLPGINFYWLYISTPIILFLALLLLGYLQKPCWLKKLRMITYIPRPHEFFKPLYQNYDGNFTEWVKPVFTEYDYLKVTTCITMMNEKQSEILSWRNEKQNYSEDHEVKDGDDFPHGAQLPSNRLLQFQDSSTSQGTVHSTGHISIHTVTLSGEEFEGEVTSQSSFRSYQDGESFGSFDDANRDNASYDLEESRVSQMDRQSGISLRENQIANDLLMENQNYPPDAEFQEAERVSLDSFKSNEHSEDGYPHVDLDTIDSGFGECSSPGASDSPSNSFPEQRHLNSNYVKQWMISSTIQEDPNNVNNELHTVTVASDSQPQLQ